MGKKYLLEIEENKDGSFAWSNFAPYTEPDLHEVCKKAYEKGHHDAAYNCHEGCNFLDDAKKKADEEYRRGYADCEAHHKAMVQDSDTTEGADAYQRGLADAWEAARKIAVIPYDEVEKIFGATGWHIFMKCAVSEVIEKLKAYEQEQEEFHVGDEFENESGKKFVVLKMNGKEIDRYIDVDGKTYCMIVKYKEMRKTGRHFPEIATVLEKMRGEQDG